MSIPILKFINKHKPELVGDRYLYECQFGQCVFEVLRFEDGMVYMKTIYSTWNSFAIGSPASTPISDLYDGYKYRRVDKDFKL